MEDARTEYGLPKIWVKLAHAYTADTRLSSSTPLRALLESLGTRLVCVIALMVDCIFMVICVVLVNEAVVLVN